MWPFGPASLLGGMEGIPMKGSEADTRRIRANPATRQIRTASMASAAPTLSQCRLPYSLAVRSVSPVFEPPLSELSPEELLVRAGREDRDAFSRLYDEFAPLVFGVALRTTKSRSHAEEVAQEVFIQVWKQADQFDPAKGTARSWIATLAHRRSVDFVRRSQSSRDRDSAQPPSADRGDIADEVVESDERARVRLALSALTDLQREAIEMAYFNGMTYREVAESIGAPLGTVKTRMRDALARIREIMEREDA